MMKENKVKTQTNKKYIKFTVAVKIGVGLALVVVGHLVLVRKSQTSEFI